MPMTAHDESPKHAEGVRTPAWEMRIAGGLFVVAAGLAALFNTLATLGTAHAFDPSGLRLLRGFWIGDVVAVIALAPAMIVGARWVASATGASLREGIARLGVRWSLTVA